MFGIPIKVLDVLNRWCRHCVNRKTFVTLEEYVGFCLPREEWEAINAANVEISKSPSSKIWYWKSGDKYVAVNLSKSVTAATDPSCAQFFMSEEHAMSWRKYFKVLFNLNSSAPPKEESEWTLHSVTMP